MHGTAPEAHPAFVYARTSFFRTTSAFTARFSTTSAFTARFSRRKLKSSTRRCSVFFVVALPTDVQCHDSASLLARIQWLASNAREQSCDNITDVGARRRCTSSRREDLWQYTLARRRETCSATNCICR